MQLPNNEVYPSIGLAPKGMKRMPPINKAKRIAQMGKKTPLSKGSGRFSNLIKITYLDVAFSSER